MNKYRGKRITWFAVRYWLGRFFRVKRKPDNSIRSKIWFSRKPYKPHLHPNVELSKRTSFNFTNIKVPMTIRMPHLPYAKFFVLPLLIFGIWFLFGSKVFALDRLEISGVHLVEKSQVEKAVFPNGFKRVNAVTFNGGKAKKKLTAMSQISDVKINKDLKTNTLTIVVIEHQSSVIWQTGGVRYLVNRFGVVYDRAPDSSPLMVVEDLKNVPVSINQKIVDPLLLEFVSGFAANLPRKTDVTVKRITVPETTFEIEMITSDGWRIILDTNKSYENQLNNLVRVLREMGDTRPREYIDLRIPDKVFWR